MVKIKTYRWSYNEQISAEEFIERIAPVIADIASSLHDMEGDIYLSDYRKLLEIGARCANFDAK
jgi:hypothetical protein